MCKDLLDLYSDYLISSFSQATATNLSNLVNGQISHDQITTFLSESNFDSKDLWKLVKSTVRRLESKEEGILIFDDSILEKPYSDENEIVCIHWDHSKRQYIKGINFLSCLYYIDSFRIPVAYEIIRKTVWITNPKTKKLKRISPITKNELMRQILLVVQKNRLKYRTILTDSWFASTENMQFIKKRLKKHFIMALSCDRLVALSRKDKKQGKFVRIDSLPMKEESLTQKVYLKGLDFPISIGKQIFQNKDDGEECLYLSCSDSSLNFSQATTNYQKRWSVEEYHKSLKCNIALEKSPTHVEQTQSNHIFAAIYGFFKLECISQKISINHFAIKSQLYFNAIKASYKEFNQIKTTLI